MRRLVASVMCVFICSCASGPPPKPPPTPLHDEFVEKLMADMPRDPEAVRAITRRLRVQAITKIFATTQMAAASDAEVDALVREMATLIRSLTGDESFGADATQAVREARRQAVAASQPASTQP